MIEIHGLPTAYQDQLEGMTAMEIAVAAATYRSSSPNRKGRATDLILRWHLRNRPEDHRSFLLLYGNVCHIVKIQRKLELCERPQSRPATNGRSRLRAATIRLRRQESSHVLAPA